MWRVNWRNPTIHSVNRVKVWRACDEHREFLRDYLASRGFPVVVTGLNEELHSVPGLANEADPSNEAGQSIAVDP